MDFFDCLPVLRSLFRVMTVVLIYAVAIRASQHLRGDCHHLMTYGYADVCGWRSEWTWENRNGSSCTSTRLRRGRTARLQGAASVRVIYWRTCVFVAWRCMFHGVTGIAIWEAGSQKLIAAAFITKPYLPFPLLIAWFDSKMDTFWS